MKSICLQAAAAEEVVPPDGGANQSGWVASLTSEEFLEEFHQAVRACWIFDIGKREVATCCINYI